MARHLITGTDQGDNLLQEDDRDDLVHAYGGFDNINTGAGNDLIYAAADMDYVIAGEGDDRAFGGDGADVLNGGAGADSLYGEADSDVLIGGAGLDWMYGGTGNDLLYSGNGTSGTEENHLNGGGGNDRLIFAWNDFGSADGGGGHDTLEIEVYDGFGPPWDDVTVTLSGGSGTVSYGSYLLSFDGIEALRVQTLSGDDTLQGGDGDDWLSVHLGANQVDAGAGNDEVTWHTGSANLLQGGLGTDKLVLSHTPGQAALVFSAAGGVVSDGYGSTLTGFEAFTVYGWVGDDRAVLGDGADGFLGWGGNDSGSGGLGSDWLKGQWGDDTLLGGDGSDVINGGLGRDVLEGGTGNDMLTGALGYDTLTGGDGADRFRYLAPEQFYDTITDFTVGQDKLVFYRSYLGLTFDDTPLDPGFLAINGPDAAHGQFVFFDASSSTPGELRWDADGTGISGGITIAILEGVTTLTGADFLLFG